ncbi:hypothetical protein HDU85_003287 [Gaertneriomyces sp. JEL0708]|nr:hypothetical protein HDU85_003287 [Gaertneriomyces sp. JEL0708]
MPGVKRQREDSASPELDGDKSKGKGRRRGGFQFIEEVHYPFIANLANEQRSQPQFRQLQWQPIASEFNKQFGVDRDILKGWFFRMEKKHGAG